MQANKQRYQMLPLERICEDFETFRRSAKRKKANKKSDKCFVCSDFMIVRFSTKVNPVIHLKSV